MNSRPSHPLLIVIDNITNSKSSEDRAMAVYALDPFRRFQTDIDSLFGTNNSEREPPQNEWTPSASIHADDSSYFLKLDLPGVDPKDTKLLVENDILKISGERKLTDKDEKAHRREYSIGKFKRQFELPDDADANNIHANFQHGVLDVAITKHVKAKPKKIEITVK